MTSEIIALFRRNLPFVVQHDEHIASVVEHEQTHVLEHRNEQGVLVGVALVNQDTILLLCVDAPYRHQRIGTSLLAQVEQLVRMKGGSEVRVGVGYTYLMPGVPTSWHICSSAYERLDSRVSDEASTFFQRRGYRHGVDHDCFDMRFPLAEYPQEATARIGDTIEQIQYRWAEEADIPAICACTEDAIEEFTVYYRQPDVYQHKNGSQGVLVAVSREKVVGAMMVGVESETEQLGSIGCTAVRHAYRGRHIASHMTLLATRHLKEMGLREAYLGYTYTGLDRMYGQAGFRINVYYMMASKRLIP